MRPFYTPPSNREFFEKSKTAYLYSFSPPVPGPRTIPILSQAGLQAVLTDQKNFRVPWGPKMTALQTFMLASDTPHAAEQKVDVWNALYGSSRGLNNFAEYARISMLTLLEQKSYELGRGAKKLQQVDIVKE